MYHRYALVGSRRCPASLSPAFSPAARSWPEVIWSYMTYKPYGAHEWVMCIEISDRARLATSNGGDRVGTSSFPAKGR
jgi:hypothetical protein